MKAEYALIAAFAFLIGAMLNSCGTSTHGSGTYYANEIPGPNGVRCFVITDGSNAVGGNCK